MLTLDRLKRASLALAMVCAVASCSGKDSGSNNGGSGINLNVTPGQSSSVGAQNAGSSNTNNNGSGNATGSSSSPGGFGSSSTAPVSTANTGVRSGQDDSTLQCPGVPFVGGDAGAACVGVSLEAEAVPVDLFIMMDRSISMSQLVPGTNTTRWEALRAAVEQFVQKVGGSDIRAGIGFFNRSGARDDDLDCDATAYATPTVEIGNLADVGPKLSAAISATAPGGLTPTLPALKGALQHAEQWATAHPGRSTVVVLATDGFPTQCQSPVSIPDVAAVASDAHGNAPFIRTFVIGLAAGFNLDTIAAAGGTKHAYLIDEKNVTDSFAQTLSNISDSRIDCDYDIPAAPSATQVVDFNQVQLVYTPASGDAEQVPRIQSLASCGRNPNGGWYYDDPVNPTRISVCPCTCARFGAGRVDLRLGCDPYIGLR